MLRYQTCVMGSSRCPDASRLRDRSPGSAIVSERRLFIVALCRWRRAHGWSSNVLRPVRMCASRIAGSAACSCAVCVCVCMVSARLLAFGVGSWMRSFRRGRRLPKYVFSSDVFPLKYWSADGEGEGTAEQQQRRREQRM